MKLIRPKLSALGVDKSVRNAAVSPIMWGFASVPAIAATAVFDRAALLAAGMLACVVLYHVAYRHLASKPSGEAAPEATQSPVPQYQLRRQVRHQRHRSVRERHSAPSRS